MYTLMKDHPLILHYNTYWTLFHNCPPDCRRAKRCYQHSQHWRRRFL